MSTDITTDATDSREQIGTVRLARPRVYPLHPDGDVRSLDKPTAVVPEGTYPVFRATNNYGVGFAYWWEMTGQPNQRGIENLGGGLMVFHLSDAPTTSEHDNETVAVTSHRMDAATFVGLLRDEDPNRALWFSVNPGAEPATDRTWRVAICVDVTAPNPSDAARQVWEGISEDLPPVVTVFPIDGTSPNPVREAVTVDLSDPDYGQCPYQGLHDELFGTGNTDS